MSVITNIIVLVIVLIVASALILGVWLVSRVTPTVLPVSEPTTQKTGGVPKNQLSTINTNKQLTTIQLTSDGTTMAVFDNLSLDIYSEISTGWSPKTTIFSGTTYHPWFTISSNVLAVTRGTNPSYLDLYIKDSISGWTFLRSISQPSGTISSNYCYMRAKLNTNGTAIFCQLHDNMYNQVQYYVLRRGTSWSSHVVISLTGPIGIGSGLLPGFAISGDGNYLARAVGSNTTTSEVAYIEIYKYNIGGSYVLNSTIYAQTSDVFVGFGQTIELDKTGQTLVTLDIQSTAPSGPYQQVYIYSLGTTATWTRTATLEIPPATPPGFGTIDTSISLDTFGDVVAISYATIGKIAVYTKISKVWTLNSVYTGRTADLADTGKLVTLSNLTVVNPTSTITTYGP